MFRGAYFPSSHPHGLALPPPAPTQAPQPLRDVAIGIHQTASVSSLPDALRCGYTSKRCENPRTVKKSGGLHRFCAYHRERANKNQWRVDNRRRLLRKKSSTAKSTSSDCESPRSTTSEAVDDEGCGDTAKNDLMDLLDPAGSPNTLSDQDAKILNAMLFSDEEDPSKVDTTESSDSMKLEILTVDTTPTFVSTDPTCVMSVSMDEGWNCACSQCLAWPTVFYYQEALGAARKARMETYGRV